MSDQQVVDRYCAKANTQRDMDECSAAALSDANHQLNATYQAVLKKWAAFPAMTTKVRQAQRGWLTYRDADVAAHFAIADQDRAAGTAGTAYPMARNLYQTGLVLERVARLCEFLRGDAYGERDNASCADLVAHPTVVPHQP
ncbi:lysozyme inhibitor LprI family protein [Dyella acidisoli]|nr:lysozyme inhibitor LprI family protein [Dyella acidisoli]